MDRSYEFVSNEEYFKRAQENLENKKLVGFVQNISYAKVFSERNKELFSKITYLNARGLYLL
ncbi:MAG: hypothetical protein KAX49_18605 [Halanaerobiales bacterium]|nr:hypothetical protein [Halanaerobiales bacterium]